MDLSFNLLGFFFRFTANNATFEYSVFPSKNYMQASNQCLDV